jgi:acyl-CoA dehydrogenase
MEILAEFGTAEQKEEWLVPLLEGEIRSGFSMTEPEVASSAATNIRLSIRRDGDDYVLNGRKWLTTGAMSARCRGLIVMGLTDPDADTYHRQSMILVPIDTPGVTIARPLSIFGYDGGGGDAEIVFDDVRVPTTNLLGEEGRGSANAQARLGPGRTHHASRAIGMAERAFDLMCERAISRVAFGKTLAEQGVVQDAIAESRLEIEQARLLTFKAAWLMDTVGNRGARVEISAIKVVAPRLATTVVDRAIQIHGGAGVSQDTPLAFMYAHARTLHIADGPDEVHKMQLARRELRRYQPDFRAR